jgi:Mor family transcriptional regulator
MHKGKVSNKYCKAIAEWYQEGKSSEQLGLEYGLSPQTIINILRRQGIPIKPKGRLSKISVAIRKKIAKEYLGGKTSHQLGLEYDLSPQTIADIARSQGVPIRPPGIIKGVTIVKGSAEREKRDALIIEKYKSGVSVFALSKEFDLKRSHIYRIFDKNKAKVGKSGNPKGNGSFRKVPLEKYSEIVEKFLAGKTMNQLGIEYNVNRNTIRNVLKKGGIESLNKLIASLKHLNCRNDIVVDTLFDKSESKKDKILTLCEQYQEWLPSERREFINWVGNRFGKSDLLAEVLGTLDKEFLENPQVVALGPVASSILLRIAMRKSGSPFWNACIGDIESEDLEKMRKSLVEELKRREEAIKPHLKCMTLEWMEIEKILRERKKKES